MTLTWRDEMNLLNDDQLKRIAFAEKESWGIYYGGKGEDGACCIIGHILEYQDLNALEIQIPSEYHKQITTTSYTPLEQYYMSAFYFPNKHLNHPEIIAEIQDYAKSLLEQRTKRITQEIEQLA